MTKTKKEEETAENEEEESSVYVFDRRDGKNPEQRVKLGGIFKFGAFRAKVCEALNIPKKDEFVLVNTNRQPINDDKSYEELVEDKETIYLLKSLDQELTAPTQERVVFIPHYDTLVKSGMYEYYASEGQNPLPFAFAELVDNALAATAGNKGDRKVEVRLMFDDTTGKHAVCVLDNGGGMTPRELNNWAIYRLSKFNRKTSKRASDKEAPRSLNSDISYFGVGGKQAIFFIGNATRMITKTKDCSDVHELCISKEEFERREKNKESIYSGTIMNRRPGDTNHVLSDEDSICKLIKEEVNKDSFTAVVITGVSAQHSLYLKTQFDQWCQQLAHIYHYYLHGPKGNELDAKRSEEDFKSIDINVVLYEKGKQAKIKELHTVDDDLQTQYIRTSASTFEFRAHVENAGCIEGVLRYHPFLYDRETFPLHDAESKLVDDMNQGTTVEDPAENIERDTNGPRGYRPIFECYWNGRLIPYTAIDSLEWCQPTKKRTIIPQECYNRFSGVLWTNDAFQVSTNKLTFMDLEVKLKDKSTTFNRVVTGQEQRVQISKAFQDWIKECHENHDKQIKFSSFQGQVKRPEFFHKHRQSPWSVFNAIEWDGKVFKAGQLIRTTRTIPCFCGTVKRFLLYGDHNGDVFATGGEMEIVQEPVSLYGETKAFPLAKLDRTLTVAQVKKFVEEEECKLPSRLTIEWPEGNKLEKNSKIPAGTTIGAMKVDIVNGKGEPINKLPGDRRKLLVEMKVIWHDNDKKTDKVITNLVCQHGGKNWPYWFRKMENMTQLGPHTLLLQVVVSDSSTVPTMKGLPSHAIKFTVTEAKPDKFTFGMLDNPLRIGVPFQIPLNLFDEFSNPTTFTENIKPKLSGSGIELSFNGVTSKRNCLYLKNVVAIGTVPSHAGKDFTLKVQLPGLEEDSQSLKIRLLPGPASKLLVAPPSSEITIENGDVLDIHVQVQDKAGNITVSPNQNVICKLTGQPNLPTYSADCSSSGKAVLTGSNISLKLSNNQPIKVKARIELQNHKEVEAVEKTIIVMPSRGARQIQVFHETEDKQKIKLEDGQDLNCVAGKTITGLSFKIIDEGNRELTMDNTLISKLKLNWVQKPPKELLKDGILPDVKAPTGVAESKFCQINMVGSVGLDFSFTIKATPDEPYALKSSCVHPKLRFGEPLQADIIAVINDKHGNKITKLPPGALKLFHISAPGLKEKEVGIGVSQTGSIVIKNIQFEKGPLGPKELAITWQKLKCYLRLEIVAGPPAKLSLVNIDTTEAISVFNNTAISVPLTVQLCDEMGNPTDENDIKVILLTDKGVKLNPSPAQVKTNSKGQATFGQPVISAPRGVYSIRIKALCPPRLTLEAPAINIRVQPDPSKPVLLKVTFDSKAVCQVGELLPVVTASVMAEDETVLKSASAKDLVLKIWHTKDGPPSDKPPPRATTLYPSRKTAADKEGVFAFRDLKVPDVSGPHCMVVQYGPGGSLCLTSEIITFTAEAGPPVRLEPESVPPTPTVSNTSRLTGRCLVKALKLNLKDKFDNNAGENLQGKVIIRVASPIDGIDEIPSLADASRHNQVEVPLVKGMATVQNVHIQENTNGKDGQEYLLNFQALLPAKAVPHPVPPFTLAFLFYNDVRKQQQMAQLTKERDHLFETIRTYRSLFDTTRQLIQEMRVSVHEAAQQEQKLRVELKKHQIADQYLQSPQCVDTFLNALSKKRQEIGIAPRRMCSLNPGPQGDPQILGKVAHLAQVEDDDVARVLSWHMASDMDCVVTLTTAKAKEVYNESNGQQQVLPLDSIYKQRLPEWNRPLPHVRSGPRNYQPPGNPVYARDKLIFPKETDNCKIVFGMLLGDTIILDDLDCANKYRHDVVKHTHCPTILTRTGDRIRSNGKFGGLQNKAPVLERMRGAVFAAPVPTTYRTLTTKIEQLQAYKQAQLKHQQAKADLELQVQQGQTPQMRAKHQECQEAENQLRMIEERLGMTPTKYDMPASPATMLHTELNVPLSSRTVAARRPQVTTGTSTGRPMVNGSGAQNRTRRASPLNSEDPRSKRARRN